MNFLNCERKTILAKYNKGRNFDFTITINNSIASFLLIVK